MSIDICFNSKQVSSLFSGWITERESQGLIKLFSDNFVSYYQMEAYQVQVSMD